MALNTFKCNHLTPLRFKGFTAISNPFFFIIHIYHFVTPLPFAFFCNTDDIDGPSHTSHKAIQIPLFVLFNAAV